MNMRPLLILLVSLCTAAGLSAQTLAPAEVNALLAKIREKRASARSMQSNFQEQRKVHLLDAPISATGKIWFQAPNKFRREAQGSAPSVTVSDGTQLWIYYPKFKSAERYSLTKHSPLDAGIAAILAGLNLQGLETTYRVTGRKEGANTVIELDPRVPSLRHILQKLDVTISPELLVTRTDMQQPNGDRVITTYSNQTSGAIPASMFEFTPPAGTDVTTPLGK
ncbi:MAG: outer membrane lipoprotein carrier protein LolA [Verrucomicrobiota bacterium]|nr:outer membrane lipoprotein carrier protein LolA [Verrucomicrobiota bacterium]